MDEWAQGLISGGILVISCCIVWATSDLRDIRNYLKKIAS